MTKIKRALISVFKKDGIVEFAQALDGLGVDIISTGGTADLLRKSGLAVKDVSEITEFPEMLDGRVKTLHPRLHGGILALRDNPEHVATLKKHSIEPIDLIVVNLYPFADALQTKTAEHDIIEMIDIGGPSMLRAAAKNYHFASPVCDPADYRPIADELTKNAGALSDKTKRYLAGKVFKVTAAYDAMISDYFGKGAADDAMPSSVTVSFNKVQDLRYGENPHQKGALYAEAGKAGVVRAKQLHGKELSFNNFLDLDAALEMAEAFSEPACAIIKHTSACGFATAKDITSAFKAAHACDPLSAFGGIVALNRPVDGRTAKAILAAGFLECIIARDFDREALDLLKTKKNLRLLTIPAQTVKERYDYKKVSGGLLLQDKDLLEVSAKDLKTVTKLKPTTAQVKDMLFAFKVCHYVKSNAIVIAKNGVAVGMGMGQPSRVDSCLVAFRKAGKRAKGAVLASDGFFPKPDSITLAKKHGIAAIIQPGGSIQDEPVIAACDKARIRMVTTGVRHFKH